MVRKFSLINENGAEYSLMDMENYCLLTKPSGLGYSYEATYAQLGNSFFSDIRKISQGRIEAVVNCKKYDNFKELVNFIENSSSLKFCYKVPYESGTKVYYKDVQIASLSKSEKQENGIISEDIIFDCLSLWYTNQIATYTIQPTENEMRWDFTWDSSFISYSSTSVQIINDGHVDAPVEVAIDGSVGNPKIELYVEGELYQTVPFNVKIEQYEKLLYGTKENNFYLLKEETDGTTSSLLNLSVINFENDNVLRIPKGKSCEIRVSADTDISKAVISIFIYYKAI